MKKNPISFGLRPGDAAVIAAVLAAAVLLLFPRMQPDPADAVSVTSEGGTVVYPLNKAAEYTVRSGGYTLTLTVENGTARVAESDCPGRDCVHTGAISRAGQSIVCMPGRLVVKIIGEEAADADWILP